MGTPAKKKASHLDDRKPRLNSFSAFVCAQPYDLSAREVTRVGRSVGYEVVMVNSVHGARNKYPHLRFVIGDPPTAFVHEFLASAEVNAQAKTYTRSNNFIFSPPANAAKRKTGGPMAEAGDINTVVQSISKEDDTPVTDQIEIDVEAPWGRRADGKPRKKTGRKSATVSLREKLVAEALKRQQQNVAAASPYPRITTVATAPTPAPAAVISPAAPPAPQKETTEHSTTTQLNLVATPKEEDEEMSAQLQQLRDSFEIGDIVHVTKPTTNGKTFTREGRIKDKEAAFATVVLGTITEKIAYKYLSLAPRLPGNRTIAHATSSGVTETRPLMRAVPETFATLRSANVSAPAPAPVSAPAAKAPAEASYTAPVVPIVAAPAAKVRAAPPTAKAVEPAPAEPLADPSQQYKDLLAWLEMGASFGDALKTTETALRAQAEQLTSDIEKMKAEIARMTADRDTKLSQANQLAKNMQLVNQVARK